LRKAATFFIGHLAYHQRAALHLQTHKLQLLSPLLVRPLTRGLHDITSARLTTEMITFSQADAGLPAVPTLSRDVPRILQRWLSMVSFLAVADTLVGDSARRRGDPPGR
jgi:hypothetical protein